MLPHAPPGAPAGSALTRGDADRAPDDQAFAHAALQALLVPRVPEAPVHAMHAQRLALSPQPAQRERSAAESAVRVVGDAAGMRSVIRISSAARISGGAGAGDGRRRDGMSMVSSRGSVDGPKWSDAGTRSRHADCPPGGAAGESTPHPDLATVR